MKIILEFANQAELEAYVLDRARELQSRATSSDPVVVSPAARMFRTMYPNNNPLLDEDVAEIVELPDNVSRIKRLREYTGFSFEESRNFLRKADLL